jgi:hypothetical protein
LTRCADKAACDEDAGGFFMPAQRADLLPLFSQSIWIIRADG